MNISKETLRSEAGAMSFREDMLEKVVQLLGLLEALNGHPYLKGKFLLKGGTALNLFMLDVPRLSVDIDLNYVGQAGKTAMEAERPKLLEAMKSVFSREGLQLGSRTRDDHAGTTMEIRYGSSLVGSGNLKVDVNFLSRVPLWPGLVMDSRPVGPWRATGISVVDTHELVAGKLVALLARRTARDLFDAVQIFRMEGLDPDRLRTAFIVYGGSSDKDWRTVSAEDVQFAPGDLKNQLTPTLRGTIWEGTAEEYGVQLIRECRDGLKRLLPLRATEIAFLDGVRDRGVIEPEHLTNDPGLAERIRNNPPLQWRVLCCSRRRQA